MWCGAIVRYDGGHANDSQYDIGWLGAPFFVDLSFSFS